MGYFCFELAVHIEHRCVWIVELLATCQVFIKVEESYDISEVLKMWLLTETIHVKLERTKMAVVDQGK